jgi:hypothetical protein
MQSQTATMQSRPQQMGVTLLSCDMAFSQSLRVELQLHSLSTAIHCIGLDGQSHLRIARQVFTSDY